MDEKEPKCCCGHTKEEHDTPSGSCQYTDQPDGCVCAGYEAEE